MKVLSFPGRPGMRSPIRRRGGPARPGQILAAIQSILEGCRAEQGRLRDEGARLRDAVGRLRRQAREVSLAQARLAQDVARLRRCAVRPPLPPARG